MNSLDSKPRQDDEGVEAEQQRVGAITKKDIGPETMDALLEFVASVEGSSATRSEKNPM